MTERLAEMDEPELHEAFDERAAIMEFDGGYTHDEAERQARLNHPLPPETEPDR